MTILQTVDQYEIVLKRINNNTNNHDNDRHSMTEQDVSTALDQVLNNPM